MTDLVERLAITAALTLDNSRRRVIRGCRRGPRNGRQVKVIATILLLDSLQLGVWLDVCFGWSLAIHVCGRRVGFDGA